MSTESIRELLEMSDQEFQINGKRTRQLVAADMLWGAFAQGLIAVAGIHGWECRGEADMKDVADRLAEKHDQPRWREDFDTAEQLQRHFLHGHMTEAELAEARQSTKRALSELLKIIEEEGAA